MPLRAAVLAADRGPRLRRDRRGRTLPGPADGRRDSRWSPSGRPTRASRLRTAASAPEIGRLLDRLAELLASGPAADETLSLLRAHYARGAGLGAAFAGVLAELCSPTRGCWCFDPRDARARAAGGADVRARRFGRLTVISAARLERAARRSRRRASTSRCERAARAPLVFFHPARADGSALSAGASSGVRGADGGLAPVRLRRDGRRRGDRRRARARSAALLAPRRCCARSCRTRCCRRRRTSAARREVAYFAQLAPLYARFRLPMPLVVPRARFRCLEPAHAPALWRARASAPPSGRPSGAATSAARRAPRGAALGPAALSCARGRGRSRARRDAIATRSTRSRLTTGTSRARRRARAPRRTRARSPDGPLARTLAERDGIAPGALAGARTRCSRAESPQERATPGLAGRPPARALNTRSSIALAPLIGPRRSRTGAMTREPAVTVRPASRRDAGCGSASPASRRSAAAASSPPRSASSLARPRPRACTSSATSAPRACPVDADRAHVPPRRRAPLPAAQAHALHAGARLEDGRGRAPRSASTSSTCTTRMPHAVERLPGAQILGAAARRAADRHHAARHRHHAGRQRSAFLPITRFSIATVDGVTAPSRWPGAGDAREPRRPRRGHRGHPQLRRHRRASRPRARRAPGARARHRARLQLPPAQARRRRHRASSRACARARPARLRAASATGPSARASRRVVAALGLAARRRVPRRALDFPAVLRDARRVPVAERDRELRPGRAGGAGLRRAGGRLARGRPARGRSPTARSAFCCPVGRRRRRWRRRWAACCDDARAAPPPVRRRAPRAPRRRPRRAAVDSLRWRYYASTAARARAQRRERLSPSSSTRRAPSRPRPRGRSCSRLLAQLLGLLASGTRVLVVALAPPAAAP